ncbi:MAG: hypothetical protein U1E28_04370 [Beijerinckiaceae bacterium]
MKHRYALAAAMALSLHVSAGQAQEERLVRECNAIYEKLCKGIKKGPEMLGQCFEKRPAIQGKIPDKCAADFQTNIENYNEAKGQQE